ncbi:MAG: zinc ribbon domain-containing protein [Candidatus Bathyarchaeia archaeon]
MSLVVPTYVRCPVCGYLNSPGSIFCSSCGNRLVPLVRAVPPPPVVVSPVVYAPPPVVYIPPAIPVYVWAPALLYV